VKRCAGLVRSSEKASAKWDGSQMISADAAGGRGGFRSAAVWPATRRPWPRR